MKQKGSGFYRVCYIISRVFVGILYRMSITGSENIPEGPAMICANHSSSADPFLLAYSFGISRRIHFVAKIELFRIPVLSLILRSLGMISVNRGISDVSTVKNTLSYLKTGEKVAIFPEGTRVSTDDEIMAKSGAVKLAERAGVPLVPVYIARKKPLFRSIPIVIGTPYAIERQKRTAEEYAHLAEDLMEKIKMLNPETRQ